MNHIQRAMVIVAIACSVISLIPPISWHASLSLHLAACLIISTQCVNSADKNEKLLPLLIMRLAFEVLGLAGIGIGCDPFVVISLAADIGFQFVELGIGIKQKDSIKSLAAFNFILIDALAIAGIASGIWPLLAVAGVVNAIAMSAFGIKACVEGALKKDPEVFWQALAV
ncbi:MAG: hypothetical protein JJU12_03965 [Chlamydiales bacterium]|nr:hypothetical protein [Chlamydiales bacterium]